MNGYIAQTKGRIGDLEVKMVLIARRMWHRVGSRYNCRGMNDDGHVANQIEKE
jgi:inositol-1,4,5-trisphosphate 5-phosphatase